MQCLELAIPPLPQLITVGGGVWSPGTQHFKRCFDVYDLIYVRSGEFFMTEADQVYELGEHELLLLQPGLVHFGHRPVETASEIYWCHFVHPRPPRAMEDDQIAWSGLLQRASDADLLPGEQFMYLPKRAVVEPRLLVPVMDEMIALHRSLTLGSALRLQVVAGEMFARLQEVVRGTAKTRAFEISEQVVGYLQAHLGEPFRAEAMEQALLFHFDYLARCLKQHTGLSPVQYLHRLQVDRAKTLLHHSDLPLQEIGEQVGLPNVNYFIRLFRRQVGMPPGAYRQLRHERA
ncbi:helix-turn-helix transcriptional regulator [Cohnella nanjingensis]|uniref:Helix-turn-helix transcriptional regulator n=1 Tax=Cohnella nanjingensis TaxID=1387779 RepID=A0A7X0RV49_9BACL|nr:AraC family transcriptional regulator [Cohnella nanjingensis]MBB6672664.1 helix-turn-helix transcriptional regulator [Cohnella nanjingensis]